MLSGFNNMLELFKNARNLQARMSDLQKEVAARRFDAETGGGMVKVTVDGRGAVVNIRIDPAAVSDVELLEDLIGAGVNAAVHRAHEAMREELAKATGGLNLAGLDELLPKGASE
jgi:nucleoid-associated protein EbfC